MRIHRVAMLKAFVHFRVHLLASWVRHLDQQRRQNHRLSILPVCPMAENSNLRKAGYPKKALHTMRLHLSRSR